jgi:hypothetical protein
MPLAQSVVGYLPDSLLKDLSQAGAHKSNTIELPLEPGKQASHIQVQRSDIDELRLGPSANGYTSVQIILKPKATFNFVSAGLQQDDMLSVLRDPSFIYGLGRLQWIAIYVGPILRQQDGIFKTIQTAV